MAAILEQIQAGRSGLFVQGYRHGLRMDVAGGDDQMAQLIVTAIEDGYTSGVEALLSYAMDGETIYGRFRDGAQTFGYTLKDDEISYWLLDGAERTDSLLQREVWRRDRNPPTQGKKGRKCVKGIKCGLSCINSKRTCRIEPSPQAKQAIQEAKTAIKGKGKGGAKPKKAKPSEPQAEEKTQSTASQSEFTIQKSTGTKRDRQKIDRELKKVGAEAKKRLDSDPDFKDNAGIWADIKVELMLKPKGFRGVRDSSGNLQAAAVIGEREKSLHLEYLATAPHNVKGNDPRKVKGAGTKAMEAIALEAVQSGKGITLEALPGAVAFYKKIGFADNGQAVGYSKGVRGMELSSDAAKNWLNSRGVKFDAAEPSLEDLEDQALGAFAVGKKYGKQQSKQDGYSTIMGQRRIKP